MYKNPTRKNLMHSPWTPRLVVLIVCGLLVASAWPVPVTAGDAIRVAITSPKDGSDVGLGVDVRGTATLPVAHHVWIVARITDNNYRSVWWPQCEAEFDPRTGAWEGQANLGSARDIGKEFEIGVAIFDEDGHRVLDNYVSEALRTEEWHPIRLPELAAPPQVITVRKVSHE